MPGNPPFLQIDLMNTVSTNEDRIIGRYTTGLSNAIEASTAFELLLSGTLWGQPHDMKGLELPNVKVT